MRTKIELLDRLISEIAVVLAHNGKNKSITIIQGNVIELSTRQHIETNINQTTKHGYVDNNGRPAQLVEMFRLSHVTVIYKDGREETYKNVDLRAMLSLHEEIYISIRHQVVVLEDLHNSPYRGKRFRFINWVRLYKIHHLNKSKATAKINAGDEELDWQ